MIRLSACQQQADTHPALGNEPWSSKLHHVLGHDLNLYAQSQRFKKNVLKQAKHRFGFKHMLDKPRHFFSAMGPQHLHVTSQQIKQLMLAGYDMESWKSGILLEYNDMYPLPSSAEIRERYLEAMRNRNR